MKGPLRLACLCFSGNGMPPAVCRHTPNQVLMPTYTLQPCLVDTHSGVAPPTLTILFLQDQDDVCLLQCDLISLLGKVCLGDLHLGQF